jgi:hypothetical protein
MKVWLTRKLADYLDGIDVSAHSVGDVIELSPPEAKMLLAEEWALPDRRSAEGSPPGAERRRSDARPPDGPPVGSLERAS